MPDAIQSLMFGTPSTSLRVGISPIIAINLCGQEFVPASGHGAVAPFLSLGSGVDYELIGKLRHWNFLKLQCAQVYAEEQRYQDD
jgi:hypothetical protein